MERQIGKRSMMTTYFSLKLVIPKEWINEILNKYKSHDTLLPIHIQWILADKSGTQQIRKNYQNKDEAKSIGQVKWQIQLENNYLD